MSFFDASALLAFLQDEDGAGVVERELLAGGMCGAANWSEVAQSIRRRGGDWAMSRGLLLSYGLTVEPVGAGDAERAAQMWEPRSPLSLGDRLCLAQAARRAATVWTADAAWGSSATVRQIR